MAILALIGFFVALVLVGVGIAVGLVACVTMAILVGLGVISSSVLVGFKNRSGAAGMRAFLIQVGIFAGIPAGAVLAWAGQAFLQAYGEGAEVLVHGAIGGALAGAVVAWFLGAASSRVFAWATDRLASPKSDALQLMNRYM